MSQNLKGIHQSVNIVTQYNPNLQPATISLKYNENIVTGVRDLSLSIDKTHIDVVLPIFTFDSTPNSYCITMEYNGVASELCAVQFIPTSNVPITDSFYWSVWTIQMWIYMINRTLNTAFTDLGTKITLPVGSKPPFVVYDQVNTSLSINAQAAYYDSYEITTPIKLYMNTKLWRFFDGIPVYVPDFNNLRTFNSPTQKDCYFLFLNNKTNTITYDGEIYYSMISDIGVELVNSWFEARGIYITSLSLRTRNEIMPNASNQTLSLPVIYHYNFNYQGTRPRYVDTVTQGPFKVIDIEKIDNLKSIDLQIYWFDKYGTAYPLYLNPGDAFNISLMFQEKI
jgi:hypothetical protein